jgi:beta-glucosidase-like glycosyl hydrolase
VCTLLVARADKAMPGGGSKTLNMSGYQWWSEATHGVSHYYGAPEETHGKDTTTAYMTNFPFPITTAMSFNRSLWHATGAQIGREARAAMNVGNAYSTFWTPVVNMARGESECSPPRPSRSERAETALPSVPLIRHAHALAPTASATS